MAKSSRKFYDVRLQRAESTAYAVLQNLSDITEEDILQCLFMQSSDSFMKKLINRIEFILLGAKVDPDKFVDTLHPSFQKLADEILSNHKEHEFFEFALMTYEHLRQKDKDSNVKIGYAYYDLVIQLSTYLVPVGRIIVGINAKNELLTIPELYPDSDKLMYEAMLKVQTMPSTADAERYIVSLFRSKGYPVNSIVDIELLFLDDRLLTNMLFVMIPFVNSLDSELLKKPYADCKVSDVRLPRYHSTQEIETALLDKKRLLPSKGITLLDDSPTSLASELYLKEKFFNDKLYLVYRLTLEGKNLSGFYNVETGFFSSVFLDSEGSNSIIFNKRVKNYILERYAMLTTNIPQLFQLYGVDTSTKSTTSRHSKPHKLDRTKLVRDVTEVDAYVRKLPLGEVASEGAIELAKRYRVSLGPNETFVRPFTKNVNHLREKRE